MRSFGSFVLIPPSSNSRHTHTGGRRLSARARAWIGPRKRSTWPISAAMFVSRCWRSACASTPTTRSRSTPSYRSASGRPAAGGAVHVGGRRSRSAPHGHPYVTRHAVSVCVRASDRQLISSQMARPPARAIRRACRWRLHVRRRISCHSGHAARRAYHCVRANHADRRTYELKARVEKRKQAAIEMNGSESLQNSLCCLG